MISSITDKDFSYVRQCKFLKTTLPKIMLVLSQKVLTASRYQNLYA